MRIVLFCENKYAVDILYPIYQEAVKSAENTLLWYVHLPKIPSFPLQKEVSYTHSIQEVYDFSPEAIFVPGNIVPYYLPGVKIQIFHGYAAEKKDHWVIRRDFDTYFTIFNISSCIKRGFVAFNKNRGYCSIVEISSVDAKRVG